MGNRAVIAFKGTSGDQPCVYLHWNGGRASVEAFLGAAKALQWNPTASTLHDIIYPFFNGCGPQTKGAPSVYVEPFNRADADNFDNGLYWINSEWQIVGREHMRRGEEVNTEKTSEIQTAVIALNALL